MTVTKTTLAQISDLHLPFPNWPPRRYWNVKRALGLLNWYRSRRRVHRFEAAEAIIADMKQQAPDHIAVTGDLVNLGLPQEYDAAQAWLEDLGTSDRISVIPGNHDIYCPLEENDHCQAFWSPYMTSDAFGCDLGMMGDQSFPFVRKISSLALVGTNSSRPTPPFIAQGVLGDPQAAAVRDALHKIANDGLVSCLMIHHPPLPGLAPTRRALIDASNVAHLIEASPVGFVIYGHNHRDAITWVDNHHVDGGKVAVCGAASASADRKHNDEPLARYYLYELTGEGKETRVVRITRGLNDAKDAVVELGRLQIMPMPT